MWDGEHLTTSHTNQLFNYHFSCCQTRPSSIDNSATYFHIVCLHKYKNIACMITCIKGFDMLHWRYALDVNVERPEDVLEHKRLLHLARDPANRPAIKVRLVQVIWFDQIFFNLALRFHDIRGGSYCISC